MTKDTKQIVGAQPSPVPIPCVRCGAPSPFPLCKQCDGMTRSQRDKALDGVVRKVVRNG